MARNDGQRGTFNRGFASMDRAKQRQIASKGGQSVPPEKRSFAQDPQLAAEAGRKGGESVPPEGRSFSQNRALAAEAGRKGGQARGATAAANRSENQADNAQSRRITSDETEALEEMDAQDSEREERDDSRDDEMRRGEQPPRSS